MTHSPTPWETDYDPTRSPNLWIMAPNAENPSLCKFETWDLGDGRKGQLHEQDFIDAAHIVRCVNNFDQLVKALEGMVNDAVALAESGDAGFYDAEKTPPVIAARAALAKARGQS